jgi:dolichol-phosphate mannosyltransferase
VKTGLSMTYSIHEEKERTQTHGEHIVLSVIVPTFNESGNISEIVRRLDTVLTGIDWEVIFVDDNSPDGTAEIVRALASADRRIRLISRHNRRGLSSAVIEGMLAATSDTLAVMDGDLQHDENVLPRLYDAVANDGADIALASRFLREDGAEGLSSEARVQLSNRGIKLANRLFGLNLTDPLTGFFVVRRSVVEDALPNLSEVGFKILLDILASSAHPPNVVELPFKFRPRVSGESKLDNRVLYDFLLFFLEKKMGRFLPIPAQFLSFALINAIGIGVHFAIFYPLVEFVNVDFSAAQLIATIFAMAFNYSVNNFVTYHDRQLRGADFYLGFVVFAALCALGVVANVGVANILHRQYENLFFAVPALAGALITVVWNYAATKAFVWGGRRRIRRRNVHA